MGPKNAGAKHEGAKHEGVKHGAKGAKHLERPKAAPEDDDAPDILRDPNERVPI
jgi:hypothetical protein